jgi:hypothetical protein
MRKYLNLIVMNMFFVIAGCGGFSPKELPVAKSAHGGTMVPLPDDRGFAEILVESGPVGKKGDPTKIKPKIVAYFFQSDGTTAMSEGPADVKIKLGADESGRVVDLAPDQKEAGKFASAAGDYPDGFAGQLETSINGTAVKVPVRVR